MTSIGPPDVGAMFFDTNPKKCSPFCHQQNLHHHTVKVESSTPTKMGKFVHDPCFTLPKTNSSPLKMDGWKTTFLLGRPIFRGYVSFREGTCFFGHIYPQNNYP